MIFEPIEEIEGIIRFRWYAHPEDFDEEGNLHLSIKAGRLRHKWVPKTVPAAILYLQDHVDMAPMRAEHDEHHIIEVHLPEGIEDLSEKYPKADPGLKGYVIKVPFEMIFSPSKREPLYYTGKKIITTNYHDIERLDTGIMDDEECAKISAVTIQVPDVMKHDGTPISDGLHDLRMGSTEEGVLCETCNQDYKGNTRSSSDTCSGHFGLIELPIYIPKYPYLGDLNRNAVSTYPIMNTLNSVCHSCSRIHLPDELLKEMKPKIDNYYENLPRNIGARKSLVEYVRDTILEYHELDKKWGKDKYGPKTCPHCGEISEYRVFSHYQWPRGFKVESRREFLDYDSVRSIFDNIIDSDCPFLAMDPTLAHPRDLFYKNIPVLPNYARPLRVLDDRFLFDDMTHLYLDVLTASNGLKDLINRDGAESRIAQFTKELYHCVSRLSNNRTKTIKSGGTTVQYSYQGGSRNVSMKGILDRFTGKKGRFRNNIQSKYVENVSYSVISPDGDLSLDEIGVPMRSCKKVTFAEKVTEENIEEAGKWIINGAWEHPGALYIHEDGNPYSPDRVTLNSPDGMFSRIKKKREEYVHGSKDPETGKVYEKKLRVGMVIARHIQDGDICLFNRAPSLHRQSIMAFRVRVVPGESFTMNATICDPFNADSDGDAMKVHFLQNKDAIKEAKEVMMVTKNLIHARYGRLAIANDQDQVSGIYLLTHTDLTRKNEWNSSGLGFTDEGIPYFSEDLALQAYSKTYSEIRNPELLDKMYREHKKLMKSKALTKKKFLAQRHYRYVESLPEPDYNGHYTGRALYSHLFKVLDCEYVTASFTSNSPKMVEKNTIDDEGVSTKAELDFDEDDKVIKQEVFIEKGVVKKGTLDKDAFGVGESSIGPSFIYHEGYEKGQAKLVEFVELSSRLGLAAHHLFGYTMGIEDLGVTKEAQVELDELYDVYAKKIEQIDELWEEKRVHELELTTKDGESIIEGKKGQALLDPRSFVEKSIDILTKEYETLATRIIANDQGSGNQMQIQVNSKARGNAENIRQMTGSFGLVRVGGNRILHGIQANRVLPHFPSEGQTAKQRGFIQGGYTRGIDPTEYWFTTSAGRRSAAESGQGNISISGYLERKAIKSMESHVVNQRRHVVNLRSNRITSFNVGDDGLLPYHIRGSDERLNEDGHIITLQPLLYDFECKHGGYLAEDCAGCEGALSGFSDVEYFIGQLDSKKGFPISNNTKEAMREKLAHRLVGKVTLRKLSEKLHAYYQDSICRPGEAIGSVSAASIGEPATQAALRTFHFAGKESYLGSVDRVKQILEAPLGAGSETADMKDPQTKVYLRDGYDNEETARTVAISLREILGKDVIRIVRYNLKAKMLEIYFDEDRFKELRIGEDLAFEQLKIGISSVSSNATVLTKDLSDLSSPIVVQMNTDNLSEYLYVKEKIKRTVLNGASDTTEVFVKQEEDGRYWLDIRSASAGPQGVLTRLTKYYGDMLELESIKTNNTKWILNNFGLEAALWALYEELDFQMNGEDGIGSYDLRYARIITDAMGETGKLIPLGPDGFGVKYNPSLVGAMSVENVRAVLVAGTSMGNTDELNGVTESVLTGKIPKVGDYAPI